MSRKGKKRGPIRRITSIEIEKHISSSLVSIEKLVQVYDGGHSYIAFTLASEIHRLLSVGGVALEARDRRRFPTPRESLSTHNLLPENKLISAVSQTQPASVTFLPVLDDHPFGLQNVSFKDWWHRDPIYRAGAAKAGADPTLIPLLESEQIPFSNREVLYRKSFVELMRNTLGAHLDLDQVEQLDMLQKASGWGVHFVINHQGGRLSTHDGTLPVIVGPCAAMMRQISYEVLSAYSD